MPEINPDKDEKTLEDVDAIVLAALKMLGGAGGHKEGFKGLGKSILTKDEDDSLYDGLIKTMGKVKSATTVLQGIGTDHTHQGNKIVTMQAFRKGLQSILDDHYICLKLLEEKTEFDKELSAKFEDPDNLKHILQILGFSKVEIKQINKKIQTQKQSGHQPIGTTICDALKVKHGAGAGLEDYQKDRKQRIQFMISGAQSYIPFAEPNDGCKFNMPIEDAEGKYHRVEMQTNRINMGQGLQGPYYALHFRTAPNSLDRDKSYAKDITVFMGTNPLPTASGPTATIHADTISGKSVGQNFVETTADQFEKLYKNQFKANLKKLMIIASTPNHPERKDLLDKEGKINYEKVWLEARTECVGQSLGGSIPLQMAARFPAFVKLSAFEPAYLLEKDGPMIDRNLDNAHAEFGKIIDEIKGELQVGSVIGQGDLDELRNAVPQGKEKVDEILKNNNTIIEQLNDPVLFHGTKSPSATHYHVTTDETIPKYNKITDKIYKAVMAGTLMSHAMVLAGQSDKKIVPIEKVLDSKMRKGFTSFLHNAVWKIVNPPLVAYFHAKVAFQKLYNPKEHAAKDPKFNEMCKAQLAEDIQGKWNAIEFGLNDLENSNTHLDGGHLHQKMQELGRMIKRANDWGVDTSQIKLDIQGAISQLAPPSEKQSIYVNLLNNELGDLTPNNLTILQNNLASKVSSALDSYEKAINKLNTLDTDNPKFDPTVEQIKMQRQEIIQYYPMLNKEKRKDLLSRIDNDMDSGKLSATSAKFGLLNDLRLRAKSNSEDYNLSKMMKKQSSNNSTSLTAKGKPVVHAHKKQQSEEGVGWKKGSINSGGLEQEDPELEQEDPELEQEDPELEQEHPKDSKKLSKK